MEDGIIKINIPYELKIFGVPFLKHKERNFWFCMFGWSLLSDYTQLAPSDWDALKGEKFFYPAIFCAARAYNMQNGLKVDFTEDDIIKEFKSMSQEDADKLYTTMLMSKLGGESIIELIGKSVEQDEKKKSHSMT